MLSFFRSPSLPQAWGVVVLWVAAYGVLKAFSLSGLDIDSAEQVYFAQSWQMGYGVRQPPLYTWLILALKPGWVSWAAALEVARYTCLLLWFTGVQAMARVCGAGPGVQARVLLLHLGALLMMWRVHDSLTHSVLAGTVTLWAGVALVKALRNPRYWLVTGVLAALACLSKLNAMLWCVSSFLAAWVVLLKPASGPHPEVPLRQHVVWMAAALLLFAALLAPYARWWLAHANGLLTLAQRIVVSDDAISPVEPPLEVALGLLEYLLLGPLLLVLFAWRWCKQVGAQSVSQGTRWLSIQTAIGLALLVLGMTVMKASHFTPRWLWPVIPGATVCMSVRAMQTLDKAAGPGWRAASQGLVWSMAALALGTVPLRACEPAYNAQRCRNCWTDRPAQDIATQMHQLYGAQPLRFVAGDDHLAGILVQYHPQDRAWTAISPDLPPPQGFARMKAPCVAVWLNVSEPQSPPDGLAALLGPVTGPTHVQALPLRRAPQRMFWLQSRQVPDAVCAKAAW